MLQTSKCHYSLDRNLPSSAGSGWNSRKLDSNVSLRAPSCLSEFFFLSKWLNTFQLSVTEHYFLGTEASVGLNQDRAAQLLLWKSNHRATTCITGLRTWRKEFFMRCFTSETSFVLILHSGLFFSQRISLSLPVLQMSCRFSFFLFGEVRDHFTSLGSVLFFPCTTSAAVFMAWIVPELVLKAMFQKCLWGYKLLVIVLSSRVFFIYLSYFPFKNKTKEALEFKVYRF